MTPLAIAHKVLKGDLSNCSHFTGEDYLYWHEKMEVYLTLKGFMSRTFLTYISTVEEFINFKGDDMETVYTQEMVDNGVSPSVGMECLLKNSGAWDFATVTVSTKQNIIFTLKDGHEEVRDVNYYDCKPLTPTITLIDGKAYQFEVRGNVFHGIYEKRAASFNVMAGQFFNDISCTNIKPLTVETK